MKKCKIFRMVLEFLIQVIFIVLYKKKSFLYIKLEISLGNLYTYSGNMYKQFLAINYIF